MDSRVSGASLGSGVTKRSPWRRSSAHPFSTAVACFHAGPPCSIACAGKADIAKSKLKRDDTCRASTGFHLTGIGNSPCVVGADRARTNRRRNRPDTARPERLKATGAELRRPYSLALLAEAYGKTGQVEEGLACFGRGIGAGGKEWRADIRSGAVPPQR